MISISTPGTIREYHLVKEVSLLGLMMSHLKGIKQLYYGDFIYIG
jgi:hypothetical protein